MAFDRQCRLRRPSSLAGPGQPTTAISNGVNLSLLRVDVVSKDGGEAFGGQCSFGLKLASGEGASVALRPDYVAPYNAITAVERVGSAVWIALEANGCAKDFPKGSNYVVAADLCRGRVMWKSDNLTSNGPILLLGDYLVTRLRLHRRASNPVRPQRPHWRCGSEAPAPRQSAKMALTAGVLVVSTNHGQATFSVQGA
jgi:hypothetical protein